MDLNKILSTLNTLIEQTRTPNFLETNRERVHKGLDDILDDLNAIRSADINTISDNDFNNLVNRVQDIRGTLQATANLHADIIALRHNINNIDMLNKHKRAVRESQGRG